MYIYTHTHTYIYIYITLYIHIPKQCSKVSLSIPSEDVAKHLNCHFHQMDRSVHVCSKLYYYLINISIYIHVSLLVKKTKKINKIKSKNLILTLKYNRHVGTLVEPHLNCPCESLMDF